MNINHYTYRVTWSAEDNEHVGLCAEFPSLSWLAPHPRKSPLRHSSGCGGGGRGNSTDPAAVKAAGST